MGSLQILGVCPRRESWAPSSSFLFSSWPKAEEWLALPKAQKQQSPPVTAWKLLKLKQAFSLYKLVISDTCYGDKKLARYFEKSKVKGARLGQGAGRGP